ncbi:MAG: hypothetical protein ABWW65_00175 [Thermoprotei archaeon]
MIREYYEFLKNQLLNILDGKILAIIVFGSSIYWGKGRDLDVVVIIENSINYKEKLGIEYEIAKQLQKRLEKNIDIHVFGYRDFLENLVPGSFLAGLALGYEIIYDRIGIEKYIFEYLERLSKEKYVLVNEYGEWRIDHHARVTLSLRKKRVQGR